MKHKKLQTPHSTPLTPNLKPHTPHFTPLTVLRSYALTVFFLFSLLTVTAQSEGTSKPQSFNIQKEIKPPFLEIVEGSIVFEDENGNNMIDAGENCKIKMSVKNSGKWGSFKF